MFVVRMTFLEKDMVPPSQRDKLEFLMLVDAPSMEDAVGRASSLITLAKRGDWFDPWKIEPVASLDMPEGVD